MIRGTLLAALGAGALTACAHVRVPWWGQGRASAPITLAARSPDEGDADLLLSPSVGLASPADAIVRVVGPQMTCTGTLVADDLVITAHHCVVDRDGQGALTGKVVPASVVQIQLGGDYLPWGTVGTKTILAPPCGEGGGRGDVAALVLERRLIGVSIMALSDQAPREGQVVDPVGFGRCALSPEGIRRRSRQGGAIAAVSFGAFEADASICPGDSGGPVLDRLTREVVGVVSLSAMDYDETTRGRSVFARVDGTPKLVAYARLVADGADPADLPPLSCEH